MPALKVNKYKLYDLRSQRRLSQMDLARRLKRAGFRGMTQNRIARIELQLSKATEEEGAAIAQILNDVETKADGFVRVTIHDLGLEFDPLGATRGRRKKEPRKRRASGTVGARRGAVSAVG
jgi:transcriptional regulator with XRE-family HTH domain